jgi:hypothetical protein
MKEVTRKRLKSWSSGLPLLAIAFIPFADMEIWRRAVVIILLCATYYAMTRLEAPAA